MTGPFHRGMPADPRRRDRGPGTRPPVSVAALAAGILCVQCGSPPPRSSLPPNVVVLLCDDAGWGAFGCYGNRELRTPHIDSIARRGILFRQGYVTTPACSPSRAGLLTGRHPSRFGHEYNITRKMAEGPRGSWIGLPEGETTIAEAFQERGYRTSLIGKWHLGMAERFHPLNHGFDEFTGFLHGPPTYEGRGRSADQGLMNGRSRAHWEGHLTDWLAEQAVAFIARSRDRPFFLFLSFKAPHDPHEPAPADEALVSAVSDPERRKHLALIVGLDRAVGRIQDVLEREGLEEHTLLFLVSDNGSDKKTDFNGPLRGAKGMYFEGGIRVPFLVQWPAHLPAGRTFDSPVSTLDIFPTALAAARSDPLPTLEGRNLLPHLRQESSAPPHEFLCWRSGSNGVIRKGRWKLVVDGMLPIALFDLEADLGEEHNVLAGQPLVAEELVADLERWDQGRSGPTWTSRSNPPMSRLLLKPH